MTASPAVITYAPDESGKIDFKYGTVKVTREPKEHELLVRVHSVGVCHTDIFTATVPPGAMGTSYPRVLGHEGSGEVEAVGPGVTSAKKGDKVLLSYTICEKCDMCTSGRQTYCELFNEKNFVPAPDTFAAEGGESVGAKFFGQSSFSSLTIVDEKSIVNVTDSVTNPEHLKKFAPLGCGLMTGSGAALNHCRSSDILVVTGIGAVGAGAIMTAKIIGCKAIIAVDVLPHRLDIAKELGATHVYNPKEGSDFVEDVRKLVDGQRIGVAIETTGVIPVMQNAVAVLGKRGKVLQIGIPPLDSSLTVPMADFFFSTKIIETNYLGDVSPQEHLPKMIKWYNEGKFPIDKIIKFYDAKDVATALEDMKSQVMKPILTF